MNNKAQKTQPQQRLMGLIVSSLLFSAAIAGYYVVHFSKGKESFKEAVISPMKTEAVPNTLSDDLRKAIDTVDEHGLSKAVVTIQTARGKIKFKFYTLDAPKTVTRVSELMQSGFYNGLTFHRVEPQFVIQGGDPTGTGIGGSGKTIEAEFNARTHEVGTVAMARAQEVNSADSQFYICLGNHAFLDGKYTVFGRLIEGQEIANQIQAGDRMTSVAIDFK